MYSCTMPVPAPGGGGAGAMCPPPPQEDVSALQKFAHYMYGNGLVEFGVVWGVSMDRTTVMLTDQIPRAIAQGVNSVTVRDDSL